MPNQQLKPQGDQKDRKSGKGTPRRAREQNAEGGSNYSHSAGPLGKTPPPAGNKFPSEADPSPVRASYDGPEGKRPPKAPMKGDRGIA